MFRLANIYQDGMVLQRQKPIYLFGETTIAGSLHIYINHQFVMEVELQKGTFSFYLPAQETCWNCLFEFMINEEYVCVLADVKIGEVWLAAGQSNMELSMIYDQQYQIQLRQEQSGIFFYEVPKRYFKEQVVDEKIYLEDHWYPANKDWLAKWCAVGFYFAKELYQTLQGQIPIGIVSCNYGGSNMLCWLSQQCILNDAVFQKEWNTYLHFQETCDEVAYERDFYRSAYEHQSYEYQHSLGPMYMKGQIPKETIDRYWAMRKQQPELDRHYGKWDADRPGGLYEFMLKTILGYSIKGVLWYQGEAESAHVNEYAYTLNKLIQEWRYEWKEQIPFLLVELAPFDIDVFQSGEVFPYIREAQQQVAQKMEEVYTISIMDAGEPHNIHPPYKEIVGKRLAQCATQHVYHLANSYVYPEIASGYYQDKQLHLIIAHASQGLIAHADWDWKNLFAAYRKEKQITIHDIIIKGNEIILNCLEAPDEVRYAFVPYCKASLYNVEGFPLKPVRIYLDSQQSK